MVTTKLSTIVPAVIWPMAGLWSVDVDSIRFFSLVNSRLTAEWGDGTEKMKVKNVTELDTHGRNTGFWVKLI